MALAHARDVMHLNLDEELLDLVGYQNKSKKPYEIRNTNDEQ